MAKYDIQMFDKVRIIEVDQNGWLRDVLKTGVPSNQDLVVIEIYHHERWGWRYVVGESDYPFDSYDVGEEDIYEVNHPPEVLYVAKDIYGEDD